jgi:carbamoyltransferase
MLILGIHANPKREDEEQQGYALHDAAAVLLRDGRLVAAVEEERLSRLKHANAFPVRAIQHCLTEASVALDAVDVIAVNRDENVFNQLAQYDWLTDPATTAPSARAVLSQCFGAAFGGDVSRKLWFCPHHIAHAWSAIAPSGFDRSLVVVADGDGDNLSGIVATADGGVLTTLREYALSKSLGHIYDLIIGLIGYSRFDEYKAMGLAPYGNPSVFESAFAGCYRLLPDGDYEIAPPLAWASELRHSGVLQRARRRGQPFTQEHKDVAAALQAMLERIVMHVVQCHQRQTGATNLCLAGGVFHNCSANGAILYSGLCERVFVQPAAHDAGGAYGAAIAAAMHHGEPRADTEWTHVYFGRHLGGAEQAARDLAGWEPLVTVERLKERSATVADLLASGAVVGWCQDRAEFGPRALGNRSILADPRPAANKSRINEMVKKREGFRPFAPAVLVERVRDYFLVPEPYEEFPFMIFVLKVRPEHHLTLGAVTHIDGTARVQTVSRRDNAPFWDLIAAFGERSGVPVLLNTSFNNHAEPIVDTIDDAVACFLTTGLDALVVGDYLVRKRAPTLTEQRVSTLVPSLLPSRRLVKRRRWNPATAAFELAHGVESTRSRYFGPGEHSIDADVYRALELADGMRSLAEILELADICPDGKTRVVDRLVELWTDRVVAMAPDRRYDRA